MDEIILSWPNVSLTYMEHRNGMSCFAEFREIERSQYGYRLTVGQELHAIRYHGTNYDIFVSPVVVEIRVERLLRPGRGPGAGDHDVHAHAGDRAAHQLRAGTGASHNEKLTGGGGRAGDRRGLTACAGPMPGGAPGKNEVAGGRQWAGISVVS